MFAEINYGVVQCNGRLVNGREPESQSLLNYSLGPVRDICGIEINDMLYIVFLRTISKRAQYDSEIHTGLEKSLFSFSFSRFSITGKSFFESCVDAL